MTILKWIGVCFTLLFSVFNAIVRLCLTDILPMLQRFLSLPKAKDAHKLVLPSTSEKWSRVKIDVKSYLQEMIQVGHKKLFYPP